MRSHHDISAGCEISLTARVRLFIAQSLPHATRVAGSARASSDGEDNVVQSTNDGHDDRTTHRIEEALPLRDMFIS